jgi:hypothetical protein
MKLVRLRLSNFRSFSADGTELDLDDLTFFLGPNGAGKTAVLQALARMFSLDPAQRKVKKSDFHVPHDEKPEEAPAERKLWIEADFEFPELLAKGNGKGAPAVPGNFAHMQLIGVKGPVQVRFRLHARLDQDDDIEESFTFVIKVDDDGKPLEEGRVAKHDRNAIQVHYLPARDCFEGETQMNRRALCQGVALCAIAFPLPALAARIRATLYKNPECGCCEGYAAYLRQNGFVVDVKPSNELAEISRKAGVPDDLQGCHTMFVENYVVDGHVPVNVIRKLLSEKPAIAGITLPGMPEGSPGMTGRKSGPFTIYAVTKDGAPPRVYATV